MKLTMIILLCLLFDCGLARGQCDTINVLFWNVENFFMPDSSSGQKTLTRTQFNAKCNGIAKTILFASEKLGAVPDAIGLAEIENARVLSALISRTSLRKLGYAFVHYESADSRGIDCALLYRRSALKLERSRPVHIRDSAGRLQNTRDILLAEFGDFALLINHHPSQIGDKLQLRQNVMKTMKHSVDSLLSTGQKRVLSIGDFNDSLWPDCGSGTIKYNGSWEKIDGFFLYGDALCSEVILDFPFLLDRDKAYGGLKPFRTFSGPRYNGGISDHLPIAVQLIF